MLTPSAPCLSELSRSCVVFCLPPPIRPAPTRVEPRVKRSAPIPGQARSRRCSWCWDLRCEVLGPRSLRLFAPISPHLPPRFPATRPVGRRASRRLPMCNRSDNSISGSFNQRRTGSCRMPALDRAPLPRARLCSSRSLGLICVRLTDKIHLIPRVQKAGNPSQDFAGFSHCNGRSCEATLAIDVERLENRWKTVRPCARY